MNINLSPRFPYVKHGVILFFLCVLTFSNALFGEFMVDDHGLFLQETRMHQWKFLPQQFVPDLDKFSHIQNSQGDKYYRPLAHVVPMMCYLWFGKTPFYYHVFNLFLFFLVALSIYALIAKLTQKTGLACLTSALFAAHPVNGLLVNYITASVYSVQLMTILWTLRSCLWAEEALTKESRALRFLLSLFLFVAALFCHETSLILPLYMFAMLFICQGYDFSKALKKSLPFIILAVIYFIFRLYFSSLKVRVIDQWEQFDISFLNYLATFGKLIIWYVGKLFTLTGIVLIWVTAPVREHVAEWLLAFGVFIALALMLIKKWGKNDPRTLGLCWFAIGFIPVGFACFFQPAIGFMMEPHWVLFPTIGFFLWLAYELVLIQKKWRTIGMLAAFTLLVCYVSVSRDYNNIWMKEKRYCQYWLSEVPGFKSVMYYEAYAHMREGNLAAARQIFHAAIDHQYNDFQIYTNLGLMDISSGYLPRAIENFEEALHYNPHSAIAYANLGVAYFKLNDPQKAESYYQKSVTLNPFLVEAWLNLAQVYEVLGKKEEVAKALDESFKIDPGDERVIFEVARLDWITGRTKRAVDLSRKALFLNQDAAQLTQLGSLAAQNNYTNLASALFNQALNLDVHYPDAYIEAGKIFGNSDQLNRAIAMWQEGWKAAPSDGRFKDLILQAKDLLKERDH